MSTEGIKAKANALKIPYLVHFTQLSNLESILYHGVYPRSRINELPTDVAINDELRLDHHDDSISLSIAHPNSAMFYRLRQEKGEDWVVLAFPSSLLWKSDCAFCKHNAADSRMSCQPIESLSSLQAFEQMFEEIDGLRTREEQNLKIYDPTDVQAEVLLFGAITSTDIGALVFHDEASRESYSHLVGNRNIYVHNGGKGLFAARSYVREY